MYVAINATLVEIMLSHMEVRLSGEDDTKFLRYTAEAANGATVEISCRSDNSGVWKLSRQLFDEFGKPIAATDGKVSKDFVRACYVMLPKGYSLGDGNRSIYTYVMRDCEAVEKEYMIDRFTSDNCETLSVVVSGNNGLVEGCKTAEELLSKTRIPVVSFEREPEAEEPKPYVHGELADIVLEPDQLELVNELRDIFERRLREAGICTVYNSEDEKYLFFNARKAEVKSIAYYDINEEEKKQYAVVLDDTSTFECVYPSTEWYNSDYSIYIK